ncbi:MAG: nuclear transport factor 2 family protein [Nonomuraea sp.]|nr:nuclear transport factor 2 family protein [Nonomuraea sp.]NUP67895.1 nuclear transport factor 2 family protein [Nonomuraea sp.]NUP80076.1 nuclear transport factor 2 family protein [Nonomuraea sp.]NUS01388.1 nuclear transport factor 2 family protein [Nonomuraea sp.]
MSIEDRNRDWVAAQQAGDAETLAALLAGDFTLVGPLGFVLDGKQWLAGYATKALVIESMTWDQQSLREYGDVTVVIGQITQRAAYQGTPADGRFRVTQIWTRTTDGHLLAGLHYSPIATPPTQA